MKKNLVIFFPSDKKVSHAYEHLAEKVELREKQMLSQFPKEKINIYMVRYVTSYLGKNRYIPDYILQGNNWIEYNGGEVLADLVLGFKMPDSVTHTYPSDIRDITIDKSLLENIFPEHTIKSIICHNYADICNNFTQIQSQKKVLKPVSESGGRGIIIGDTLPKEKELLPERFPYLLQDFHDTSGGFYNIHDGTHDFRVVILDGEIIGKILRTPKKGSLVCNTGSGGTLLDIWDFEIPESIMNIITHIDNYCSRYSHRYYSIDLGIGKNGDIKVYELNSAAALSNEHIAHKLGSYIAQNILKVS